MRFPRLKSQVSATESLIDMAIMSNNLSTSEEAGIKSSKPENLWNNLIVSNNESVDFNPLDSPDRTPNPLTAKNLEALSNLIDCSDSSHSNRSSRTSTGHSGAGEDIVKQVENQDRQELPPIGNTTETTIANILSLYRNPNIHFVNFRTPNLVEDLVGRLIHINSFEPSSPASQPFGPPPVAGKQGLLSWLTQQEKMAEEIIESRSREFFLWGWNPAIFARAVRLGVSVPCKVPYRVSRHTAWYNRSNEKRRATAAWNVYIDSIAQTSQTESYGFRALADDFFSGRKVKEPKHYAQLKEPETPTAEDPIFHITEIDMEKYGNYLYRNLYARDSLGRGKNKNSPRPQDELDLFMREVIELNEIEDALLLVEKNKKLEKSSSTVARVHDTDIRRSSKYKQYIKQLDILEKTKEEAGKAAARIALKDFVQNLNVNGLDSIMGSETWSVTHIRTIPTLDEPAEEQTIIESITSDNINRPTSPLSSTEVSGSQEAAPKKKTEDEINAKVSHQEEHLESAAGETTIESSKEHTIVESITPNSGNRSTSPLSITDIPGLRNETAVKKKKKKKKAKGKTNALKGANHEENHFESAAGEIRSEPAEIANKAAPSIASDPLNYDFDDSRNPVIDEDSNWEVVKPKPIKPRGARVTQHSGPDQQTKPRTQTISVATELPSSENSGQKKGVMSSKNPGHTAAGATIKTGEKFEIESLNDFPAIISPWKKVMPRKFRDTKGEPSTMVQQPAPSNKDLDLSASIEDDVDHVPTKSEAPIAATILPNLPSKEQSILPVEVAAEDIFNANDHGPSADVNDTLTLTCEMMEKEGINDSIKEMNSASTISSNYEAGSPTTSLQEKSPPFLARNMKDHSPVYLGDILNNPSRAFDRGIRSLSAKARFFDPSNTIDNDNDDGEQYPDSATVIGRPQSVAKMSSMDLINQNAIAVNDSPAADHISMNSVIDNAIAVDISSAVDIISSDNIGSNTSSGTNSPISDSSYVDVIVNSAPTVSDSGSRSVVSSTMTIHGPQPRSFHHHLMGLDSFILEFTAPSSVEAQTTTQQASVASYDVEQQSLSQFSNGWNQQQLSTSTILHAGHAEPSSALILFDCTYCAKSYYASTENPMVLCHGCGPSSSIRYCSIACLLAGSLYHADVCQEGVQVSGMPMHNAYQIRYVGPLATLPSGDPTVEKSTYKYRQKVFSMFCHSGKFPQLLAAWARQNNLVHTDRWQGKIEATMTGSYFIFKSSLSSNGRRTNPDSTVICTIKFRPDDLMLQIVDRCLRACFSLHCRNEIKEFLFRLVKNYLSDDDSFGCFPHTEDRTTVLYEFQYQFNLEFGFHAEMQRNQSEFFDFQSEWPEVEYLLSQFEIEYSN
ncbi:hypothetical protein NHQ30_011488 [Ciborinia camelliae]|nr:hypothetical protein NHQ30_011488 [Ciborinia camelliae]